MIRDDLGVYLATFSHLRAKNVAKLQEKVGQLTWYVGEGERAAYEAAGAARVVESGGLCESRNAALVDGWAAGRPVLEMSDDLGSFKQVYSNDGKINHSAPIALAEVVARMLQTGSALGAMLVGVAPTANKLFFNSRKPVSDRAFIVGDFILVHQCGLLFDTQLKLKEDYDYTMQHLTSFGRVARCNSLLVTFSHRTNDGGAVAFRTPAREQEAIAYLRSKWGERIFRDNPKRANEVIMDLKGLGRG
jgi:hypothetical protein